MELIKTEQEISLKMLAGFAKRLKSLINQLEDVSSREVPGRLAKYLLGEIKSAVHIIYPNHLLNWQFQNQLSLHILEQLQKLFHVHLRNYRMKK